MIDFVFRRTKVTSRAFSRFLEKCGFKFLGGGSFAIVFEHPDVKNYVVKVANIYGLDDPTLEFLEQAIKNRNNVYFPKFHSITLHQTSRYDAGCGYAVIVMERLQDYHPLNKDGSVFEEYERFNVCNRLLYDCGVIKSSNSKFVPTQPKHYKKTVNVLRHLFDKFVGSEDLHPGNVMWRDSQLVVIDPVCP